MLYTTKRKIERNDNITTYTILRRRIHQACSHAGWQFAGTAAQVRHKSKVTNTEKKRIYWDFFFFCGTITYTDTGLGIILSFQIQKQNMGWRCLRSSFKSCCTFFMCRYLWLFISFSLGYLLYFYYYIQQQQHLYTSWWCCQIKNSGNCVRCIFLKKKM